jgi:hypothetical protein
MARTSPISLLEGVAMGQYQILPMGGQPLPHLNPLAEALLV